MESGLKIRLMERAFYISRMVNHNMMANGGMIYIMDGGHFILKLEVGINTRDNLEMV